MRRLPVGARALLVELDGGDVVATYTHIRALIDQGVLPAARDVVPAARTILVDGIEPDSWWQQFVAVDQQVQAQVTGSHPETVTVPIRYDGEDLDDVALAWGCGRDEVVRRHQDAEFTVAFCGFAPGFAYCTSEPPLPEVPRRDDPRPNVPAGAVGLAGPYCGIYPVALPGGWQLIGSTTEVMFDAGREPPARLQPGDRVRFHVEGRR